MRKVLLLIFIIFNGLIISACNEPEEEETTNENTVTPVETEEVETGDFVVERTMYGHLSPIKQTPVMVQQPGEVSTLKVENGDEVKKNDHLATIKTPMGNQAIYAPVAGEIANLNVQEDSFQSNEEPFALIVDLDKLEASFSVTPQTRNHFKAEQKVDISVDDKEYEATVLALDTMPNDTGQYAVKVELNNEGKKLLPGMTATVIVPDKKVKDTIIVPTAAVVTESDESFVYTVSGDTANKVMVEIKESQSDRTAVEADLEKGDQVIVNGQFTLSDGAKVDVVKEGK